MKECPEAFFFGGAGWGGGYYIGIYKAMQELWGNKILEKKCYGISAGSLICMYILLGYSWEIIDKEFIDITNEAKALNNRVFFKVSYLNNKRLEKYILKDDYKKLNGKLFVGVTSFYGELVLISNWNSNQELIDTLHASSHIPYYCGNYINKIRDKKYIDGGYSFKDYSFLPDKTLKIGVWNKDIYDIKLTPTLSFTNSRKPNLHYYYWIKEKGYKQLLNWNEEFISIKKSKGQRKFKKHIRLSTAWLLRSTEYIFYNF